MGYTAPKLSKWFGKSRQPKSKLDEFKEKNAKEKQKAIDEKWETKSPVNEMLEERSFFEEIMGDYRYKKSDGWFHTKDISSNFKGVDFFQGTEVGNQIFADVAVSMKTTTLNDVDKWLASATIKKNIGFLNDGLNPTKGIQSNHKIMYINSASIHIYMPKKNITKSLEKNWLSKLNSTNPLINFEIKALEDFIK